MERPNDAPQVIKLADLPTDYYRLGFMVNEKDERIARELQLSKDAGELVARIYKAVLPAYDTNDASKKIAALQSLNKLCVRLVFLFYAEDAGLFPKKNQFCDYMKDFSPAHFRRALVDLFRILNTHDEERDKYEEPQLLAFPYVNGGLFSEKIDVPQFSEDAVKLIIEDGGGFDWSQISPTIFGAIFESTLNPAHRREGGMHYTSPENIHKVIDPLFLDGYRAQFQAAMAEQGKARKKKLLALQDELARAKFFDPAAGSGNFLTESYRSLRRLENDILRELITKEKGGLLGFEELNPIKVSINQFYGIEINDFAVSVAKTAIWIAESQCFKETEDIIHRRMDFLPLKTEANIHEGNALRMDWREILPPSDEVYLMGNPPFVGARIMAAGSVQKTDMANVFDGWKNFGNLDYVSAWYKKAADYMAGTRICAAFVSTKSVTQGDTPATLWKPLFERGVKIFFAHHTFKWSSESKNEAAVYCVIVGFSYADQKAHTLYTDGQPYEVNHINAYLMDAPDIFVESRSKPLCDVPEIGIGNKPIDGGNYLFTEEERDAFLKLEPKAKKYFKTWYDGKGFLYNKPRHCLWLGDCPPNELMAMPLCKKRVAAVREYRLNSPSAGTRKIADTPTRFHVENMPKGNYIVIPEVTSSSRRYIPIGFLDDKNLCSNKLRIIPNVMLYHFGILTSNVHMAWMRVTSCRLGGGV
ncbi:MAG: class I SAM-dependent DNA methyltransferase [Acetobacter sp.]|nr:class I SAM-dependent DNA methyltransferase [Acetobacter sp.]